MITVICFFFDLFFNKVYFLYQNFTTHTQFCFSRLLSLFKVETFCEIKDEIVQDFLLNSEQITFSSFCLVRNQKIFYHILLTSFCIISVWENHKLFFFFIYKWSNTSHNSAWFVSVWWCFKWILFSRSSRYSRHWNVKIRPVKTIWT